MLPLCQGVGMGMPCSLLLDLPGSIASLLVMMLSNDLISHLWRQADILDAVAVWTPELLSLSELWQDLGWHCRCQTYWV